MSDFTERLHLPFLQTAQAQKEVTHNEALARLDRWVHPRVESRTVTAPPADPADGALYIVPPGGAGDWSGRDGEIAEWQGRWTFLSAPAGLLAWIADENAVVLCGSGGWSDAGFPVDGLAIGGRSMLSEPPDAVANPNGGVTIDHEARAQINQLLVNLRRLGLVAAA